MMRWKGIAMSKELAWFIVYMNTEDGVAKAPPKEFHKAFLSLYNYARTGKYPANLDLVEDLIFCNMKSGVEDSVKRHEDNCERTRNATESKKKQNTEAPTAPEESEPKKTKTKIFKPPTVEEVKAYCMERKNGIDPDYFVDYYQRDNWIMKNGRKMSDWKAAVRTWERNNYSSGRTSTEDLTNDTSRYGEDSDLWANL